MNDNFICWTMITIGVCGIAFALSGILAASIVLTVIWTILLFLH
jgi:hypothetical protein